MPSKSQAQFGEMGLLYSQGKISRKTLEDFNKGVHPKSLPKHVGDSPVKAAAQRRSRLRGPRGRP
jgi:hypothetical protein